MKGNKKIKCSTCKEKFKPKNKKVKYCSNKCFMKYLNSKEFDDNLNKILNA